MSRFDLAAFEGGSIDLSGFDHRAHVEAAFALLQKADFDDAAHRYCRALRRLATSAGHPEKFHMTITLAMLAAIAEREPARFGSFETFIDRYPELEDRALLGQHYSSARLAASQARTTFLLPDRAF